MKNTTAFDQYWIVKSHIFEKVHKDEPKRLHIFTDKHVLSNLLGLLAKRDQQTLTLQNVLTDTERQYQKVVRIFKENRFAPFWTAVEECAESLIRVREEVENLVRIDTEYNKICGNKEFAHNLPSLHVPQINFRRVQQLAARLDTLVRKAESIIDFALIYEHRATRKEIVKGFRGLSEVIEAVGSRLETTLIELGRLIVDTAGEIQDTLLYVSAEQIEAMEAATGLQIEALDLISSEIACLEGPTTEIKQLIDISRESEDQRSAQRLLMYEEAQKHTDALDDIRRGRIPIGYDPRKCDTEPKK